MPLMRTFFFFRKDLPEMDGHRPERLLVAGKKLGFYFVDPFVHTKLLHEVVVESLRFFLKRDGEYSDRHFNFFSTKAKPVTGLEKFRGCLNPIYRRSFSHIYKKWQGINTSCLYIRHIYGPYISLFKLARLSRVGALKKASHTARLLGGKG